MGCYCAIKIFLPFKNFLKIHSLLPSFSLLILMKARSMHVCLWHLKFSMLTHKVVLTLLAVRIIDHCTPFSGGAGTQGCRACTLIWDIRFTVELTKGLCSAHTHLAEFQTPDRPGSISRSRTVAMIQVLECMLCMWVTCIQSLALYVPLSPALGTAPKILSNVALTQKTTQTKTNSWASNYAQYTGNLGVCICAHIYAKAFFPFFEKKLY